MELKLAKFAKASVFSRGVVNKTWVAIHALGGGVVPQHAITKHTADTTFFYSLCSRFR
jgi:hypothetical protein